MSRGGWLNELKLILTSAKPNGFWAVKENCINEAKKYCTKTQFSKNAVAAYKNCRINNWLDKACTHMKNPRQSKGGV